MHEAQRAMMFVDGQNLYQGLRLEVDPAARLDFDAVAPFLAAEHHLVRAYWFEASTHPRTDAYYDAVRLAGYRLVTTPFGDQGGRDHQIGTDVAIATELGVQAHADAYDVAILVSGDGDFLPAVHRVQDLGKRVHVASFDRCLSRALAVQADHLTRLDAHVDTLSLHTPADAQSIEERS